MSSSPTPAEHLPVPSPSERPARRSRAMTTFGYFLSVSGLCDEAVVLEWEREYTEALEREIDPTPLPF